MRLLLVPAGTIPTASVYPSLSPGFHARTVPYTDEDGNPATQGYQLFIPVPYDTATPIRCVLSCPGNGKDGTDNTAQLTEGFAKYASDNSGSYPDVMICLQMPVFTVNNAYSLAAPNAIALGALAQTMAEVNVDTARIGWVGVSNGARIMWPIFLRNLSTFAFGVGIAGLISETQIDWALGTSGTSQAAAPPIVASYLGSGGTNLPLFTHHYTDDGTVLVARGRAIPSAFGNADFVSPFTTNPTRPYSQTTGAERYDEDATGGHAWDDIIPTAISWYADKHR